MKKRISEGQIIGFLREADAGLPVKDLCRRQGFSEASYCLWKAKYGGMTISDARRLKKLLAETLPEAHVAKEAPRRMWWAYQSWYGFPELHPTPGP